MNKNTKILYLISCILLFSSSIYAQQEKPHYRIAEDDKNISITAQLSLDATLTIYLPDVNHWQGKEEIQKMILLAGQQYNQLKDSYQSDLSQKNLFLRLPVHEELLSINISEKDPESEEMIYINEEYFSMKTTVDTILILQDIEIQNFPKKREEESTSSTQYVFSLSYMEDIITLSEDKKVIDKVSHEIDSVINVYKEKWRNKSNKRLSIDMDYKNKVIEIDRPASFIKNIHTYVGFGVEVLGNKFPVVMDLGFTYVSDRYAKESGFIGLNLKSFSLYNLDDYKKSTFYASIGMELGLGNTESGILRPLYAMGISYFINNSNERKLNDSHSPPNMFRMSFSMAVISRLNVGFNVMTNFKISPKAIINNKEFSVIGVFMTYYL